MLDRLQKTQLSAAQNQFTAYLVAAIRNYKAVYLKRRQKRLAVEIPLDQVDDVPAARSEPDYLRGLPPLQQLGNESLFHAGVGDLAALDAHIGDLRQDGQHR